MKIAPEYDYHGHGDYHVHGDDHVHGDSSNNIHLRTALAWWDLGLAKVECFPQVSESFDI